jgi:hypothetical protein
MSSCLLKFTVTTMGNMIMMRIHDDHLQYQLISSAGGRQPESRLETYRPGTGVSDGRRTRLLYVPKNKLSI